MKSEWSRWTPAERVVAGVVSGGVVGAALWPLRQYLRPREERVDSFPLSYYPMFSVRREQHGTVSYPVGVRADGSRTLLPHGALGAGGVNQVRKQLSRAVQRGRATEHAQLIARKVAERPDLTDIVTVEIVRGRFDFDACLLNRKVEGEETLLASAAVTRSTDAEPTLPAPTPEAVTR
ncbi:MAG TPA: hypothetical protein VFE65_20705 [Pseudonocardia sp.]|nr:hypothetical protein [Pseudonocardia sp.]